MPTTVDSSLLSLFASKAWANEELLQVLAAVDAAAHAPVVHNALRILNHIYVVDSIFMAHLQGVAHGHAATNTPETPSVAALAAAVRELDLRFCAYVGQLTAANLQQRLAFTFTDGDSGLMSREEMLLHVITHGSYHRGAAGQVLRGAGATPPRDLYTRFLHLPGSGRRPD
jgi:uncharacterized damage-inducible protein DinB